MASDKIYCENCSDGMYSHIDKWEGAENIEYIRKDALLDKLNLALELRTDDNPDINTDGVQTIKAMINYIKSL